MKPTAVASVDSLSSPSHLRAVKQKMRVALFGFYNHGNFGDDLMGVMLGRFLADAGFDVRVFGITRQDAADWSITRSADLQSLLHDADVVVLGGGGLLLSQSVPWPSIVHMYRDLQAILDHCSQRGVPIIGVSLGGSGDKRLADWQQPAIRFINQARFCTLRNPQDQRLAHRCRRTDFPDYPDIVWLTRRFFPQPRRSDRRPTIAVDLPRAPRRLTGCAFAAIRWVLDRQTDADVIYLDTSSTNGVRPQAATSGTQPSVFKFSRLRDDLQVLANVDLLITRRLHAGLAAMSYGGAMVTVGASPKAKLLLQNIGRPNHNISASNFLAFLWRLKSPRRWQRAYPPLPPAANESLCEGAEGHLRELLRALNALQADRPHAAGK